MVKPIDAVFYVALMFGLTFGVWSTGWFLYDAQELWKTYANYNFQNILIAIIGTLDVLVSTVAIKSKRGLTDLDKKTLNKMFKRATDKMAPRVQKLQDQVDVLDQEIKDLKLAFKAKPGGPTK